MPKISSHDLDRFVEAQSLDYVQVLNELRAGRKTSHWIWYIFPQLRGLGHSEYSWYYGIADIDEATAYLAHPVLGAHLRECCEVLLSLKSHDALAIFGYIDSMKVKSCMTLFATVSNDPIFLQVLDEFYDGESDHITLNMLGR
jgi:uncharacterized protein (DUF1810 family)